MYNSRSAIHITLKTVPPWSYAKQQPHTFWYQSVFTFYQRLHQILNHPRDFHGGPVVKNPPSNARDTSSIPGRGTKIPHAAGQISPCTTTTGLACLNKRARVPQTTEPTCSGAHTPWSPHTTTRERPMHHNKRSHVPQLRPNTAKKKKGIN